MNGLEALPRLERDDGRRDPTVSWYVEGLLGDPGEGGHAFETSEALAPLGVAPNSCLRLRILDATDKDPDPAMLKETRAEVRDLWPTLSSARDGSASTTVFKALRRPEGAGVARRNASHHGRKETPC
jgi:hypothetical protein